MSLKPLGLDYEELKDQFDVKTAEMANKYSHSTLV